MAETYFTTEAEIRDYYSTEGTDFHLDDLSDDDNAINRARGEATDLISQYALQRYPLESLADSPWVIRRATVLACYYLSMRRGNPPPMAWQLRRDEILSELQDLVQGKIVIPNLSPDEENIPVVSSQLVDPSFRRTPLRTDPYHTTGDYPGRRDLREYGSD